MLACNVRNSSSVYVRITGSLTVTRRSSTPLGIAWRVTAKCMSRRATSISRTAPRAHGITSVVNTERMPSSWQMATSSALTPVVSAAVNSVTLPMPMSISAPG